MKIARLIELLRRCPPDARPLGKEIGVIGAHESEPAIPELTMTDVTFWRSTLLKDDEPGPDQIADDLREVFYVLDGKLRIGVQPDAVLDELLSEPVARYLKERIDAQR